MSPPESDSISDSDSISNSDSKLDPVFIVEEDTESEFESESDVQSVSDVESLDLTKAHESPKKQTGIIDFDKCSTMSQEENKNPCDETLDAFH